MNKNLFDELLANNIFQKKYVKKDEYLATPECFRDKQIPDTDDYIIYDGCEDLEQLKVIMMARQTKHISNIRNMIIFILIMYGIGALYLAVELSKL